MVYGTATDASGAPMADTWIQVKQGTNSATTKTDAVGIYVFFDGQQCFIRRWDLRLLRRSLVTNRTDQLRNGNVMHTAHDLRPKRVAAFREHELPWRLDQG